MAAPPEEGYVLLLTRETIQWILGGVIAVTSAILGWVWRQALQVNDNRSRIDTLEQENEKMRRTIREVGNALANKIDTETQRLESKVDGVQTDLADQVNKIRDKFEGKMDELREHIPSRQFIETQNAQMTLRIDRLLESKINPR